jgi:hypothetical protein
MEQIDGICIVKRAGTPCFTRPEYAAFGDTELEQNVVGMVVKKSYLVLDDAQLTREATSM